MFFTQKLPGSFDYTSWINQRGDQMTESITYEVVVSRSGSWWAIEIPELPGAFSQVNRLEEVEQAAREAIAMVTDNAATSFSINTRVDRGSLA